MSGTRSASERHPAVLCTHRRSALAALDRAGAAGLAGFEGAGDRKDGGSDDRDSENAGEHCAVLSVDDGEMDLNAEAVLVLRPGEIPWTSDPALYSLLGA